MERVPPGEADPEPEAGGVEAVVRVVAGWAEHVQVPAREEIAFARRAEQRRLISQAFPAISSSVRTVEPPW
jgi:hypothetical protein